MPFITVAVTLASTATAIATDAVVAATDVDVSLLVTENLLNKRCKCCNLNYGLIIFSIFPARVVEVHPPCPSIRTTLRSPQTDSIEHGKNNGN